MRELEKALAIAIKAHEGQTDKQGVPYILHPIRVMARLDNETDRVVALLHDVVEDSPTTFDDLRKDFSEEVVSAVDHLTRRSDETYDAFIERVKKNPIAIRVKLADLADNTDPRRGITRVNKSDRYRRAISSLLSVC